MRLGQEQQALQRLEAVLQRQPADIPALCCKSNLLAERGDITTAHALLDKALACAV
jgi:predicted Zn-dependent protease